MRYVLYQLGWAFVKPESSPALEDTDPVSLTTILSSLLPPIILIVAVLGSILTGVATPTEAAGVGAVGTLLLAGDRLSQGSKRIRSAALALAGLITLVQSP